MLGLLTGKWRWRAARLLVVLYALCLAAPTAVLALGLNAEPAHCLTEAVHGATAAHDHQDGSGQHHSGTGDSGHSDTDKCCGIFFVSAIAPDVDVIAWQHPPAPHLGSPPVNHLSGRDSDRIDRPPRVLPSI